MRFLRSTVFMGGTTMRSLLIIAAAALTGVSASNADRAPAAA
jgi:hypothetical protein